MNIYVNQVCGTRALLARMATICILGIAALLFRDCVDPAYAEAQRSPVELDAGVADYSDLPIADLVISHSMMHEVLTRMLLVRMVVSEAGWNAIDHSAILHLIRRRAEVAGISIEAMARKYSAPFKVAPTDRLKWTLSLEPSCSEPSGWPSSLNWSDYEQRCVETFARIDSFVRGELPDPCAGNADHFGSEQDHYRAKRAGWRRVSCGKTANRFYKERGGVVDTLKAKGGAR